MRRKIVVANVFGAIGYMLLVAAWAFSLAVILAILFETTGVGQPSMPLEPTKETVTAGSPSPVVMVASYAITGLVVLVSLGILVTLPYFVGKWGARIVKGFMKLTRIDMTRKQLLLVKGCLAALPLLVLMVLQLALTPEGIVFAAMFGATVAASLLAIVAFLMQALLARRQKLSIDEVW